jgi:hypothetical protein
VDFIRSPRGDKTKKVVPTTAPSPYLALSAPNAETAIFGVDLELAVQRSNRIHELLPDVIYKCFIYLKDKAPQEEGIFRITGSVADIKKIREAYDEGQDYDISSCLNPHTVAGTLKLFIRELPGRLIPSTWSWSDNRPVQELHDMVSQLTPAYRCFLSCLIKLLQVISQASEVTKMGVSNLVIVFSAALQCTGSFLTHVINYAHDLFPVDELVQTRAWMEEERKVKEKSDREEREERERIAKEREEEERVSKEKEEQAREEREREQKERENDKDREESEELEKELAERKLAKKERKEREQKEREHQERISKGREREDVNEGGGHSEEAEKGEASDEEDDRSKKDKKKHRDKDREHGHRKEKRRTDKDEHTKTRKRDKKEKKEVDRVKQHTPLFKEDNEEEKDSLWVSHMEKYDKGEENRRRHRETTRLYKETEKEKLSREKEIGAEVAKVKDEEESGSKAAEIKKEKEEKEEEHKPNILTVEITSGKVECDDDIFKEEKEEEKEVYENVDAIGKRKVKKRLQTIFDSDDE